MKNKKKNGKREPFELLTFCSEYPTMPVSDHEVYLSFVNDIDAEWFGTWWTTNGRYDFQEYLDAHKNGPQ
jgi:hypothetical protein